MNSPLRISPVFEQLSVLPAEWTLRNNQQVATRFVGHEQAAATAGIIDVSHRSRFGCKGPHAAQWLSEQGLPVPQQPNSWVAVGGHGFIARLGVGEFLIEGQPELIESLKAAQRVARVYPVPRQDAALILCGARLQELLLQVCSFNFRDQDCGDNPVVLTSMAGVAVVAIPQQLFCEQKNISVLRLFFDGTYGPYLWNTLADICAELGGGPAGLAALHLD